MGSLLAVASCVCYAIWLIIQAKMMKEYPCHYSCTALMCLMGTVQSIIFALCLERDWEQWRLGFDIRLLAVIYSGVVGSGLILTVLAWCIKKKGPLYASIFNPLMLVIVALLSSLLLNEKLHLGSVLGAVLIVIGLYIVLWGKGREAAKVGELPADESIDVIIASGDNDLQEQCTGPHGPTESKQ
ncbi:putative WAT1-related protein [Cocos nucifera]|uniref:WAT1-related protein n=1 Tax=Cocos nucifera TaxID=13894 RepID=A0A8K0HXG4_COCNU|nr:putative WAT1-related protein [Cocos nucifera]